VFYKYTRVNINVQRKHVKKNFQVFSTIIIFYLIGINALYQKFLQSCTTIIKRSDYLALSKSIDEIGFHW